jgi:hypothetical protein
MKTGILYNSDGGKDYAAMDQESDVVCSLVTLPSPVEIYEKEMKI